MAPGRGGGEGLIRGCPILFGVIWLQANPFWLQHKYPACEAFNQAPTALADYAGAGGTVQHFMVVRDTQGLYFHFHSPVGWPAPAPRDCELGLPRKID